jgi:hypothetical protein
MRIHSRFLFWLNALILLFCANGILFAQKSSSRSSEQTLKSDQSNARDLEVASYFGPIIYQALGDKPRSDYITNFDFDGDWRGDNNWSNAENTRFPLKAYVYYSVIETSSHFFIHYAIFHPRDYKGGEQAGTILSALIREGAKLGGKYDPTGLADESVLAHENDLEGCLLVVAKSECDLNNSHVIYVETLRHNVFSKYVTAKAAPRGFDTITMDGPRVLLYVEPKGHGIEAYVGGERQTAGKSLIAYTFTGTARQPESHDNGLVGYDLLPIRSTLWLKLNSKTRNGQLEKTNLTYGATHDYGKISIDISRPDGRVVSRKYNLGKLGSAFLGKVGGPNMARPPWAWSDRDYPNSPMGLWFFDPAKIIKRDFKLNDSFPTAYLRPPFWTEGR